MGWKLGVKERTAEHPARFRFCLLLLALSSRTPPGESRCGRGGHHDFPFVHGKPMGMPSELGLKLGVGWVPGQRLWEEKRGRSGPWSTGPRGQG